MGNKATQTVFDAIKSEKIWKIGKVYADIAKAIKNGADLSATDENGNTPLHLTRHVRIAQLLLKHKAPLEAKDQYGQTPLVAATLRAVSAANMDARVIYTLLINGADTSAPCIIHTDEYIGLYERLLFIPIEAVKNPRRGWLPQNVVNARQLAIIFANTKQKKNNILPITPVAAITKLN